MGLAKTADGYTLPRRFVDLEKWGKELYGEDHPVEPESPTKEMPKIEDTVQVNVKIRGPYKGGRAIPEGAAGWNAGDIDFRSDGAIFIRNPYLADAIERHLEAAYKLKKGANFLKIVRDEGWSGTQTNIVC
ncbi:MAG TPA: hypothetical protein VFX78_11895 [Candidatus Eisenbacteria bacterium]|jgi:hypothetical protein|nr:hypothetical protein [Candidatus Eisenbacteria bacterium]